MHKDKKGFQKAFQEKFRELEGKSPGEGTHWEQYHALVLLLMDQVKGDWEASRQRDLAEGRKEVYYFSMEFLIGKLLSYTLNNLGVKGMVTEAMEEMGIHMEDLYEQEKDAGLGNGGLGRLAACFLDSMAFLGLSGHGNGIRYRHGLFQQKLIDGYQVEVPDEWLKNGYPWDIRRPEEGVVVRFRGNVSMDSRGGRMSFRHEGYEAVMAVPYDVPLISYDSIETINTLRLWSAEPVATQYPGASLKAGFDPQEHYQADIQAISGILYPEDYSQAGKELRLKQEYFFVAAGLASILRHFRKTGLPLSQLPKRVSIHINDTHPALCVPELMRLLMDENGLGWEEAWNITINTLSYTNHTIMPEALEKWPVYMMQELLPRIWMIIEEIDRRFKEKLANRFIRNRDIIANTTPIYDNQIWMANLAVIGSHSVNGVSQLHTDILKKDVHPDFNIIYPYKYNNKTNGVSHRRFLLESNPSLSRLITKAIGADWIKEPEKLQGLLPFKKDAAFLEELGAVKYENKVLLSNRLMKTQNVSLDPDAVFDVQVKRIHAYKRQLLNVFKIMDLYNRIKEGSLVLERPYVFLIGGKAAPGYHYAKSVIKLIHSLGERINADPVVKGMLKVVFVENFNVSIAQLIYPAADISEQISTASREASGTGNMKFMMNGAVTLGTLDGANVEIQEAVGEENIFIFGLRAETVIDYYLRNGYRSMDLYESDPRIRLILDQLTSGWFREGGGDFTEIRDSMLRDNDHFFVLKDFQAYTECFLEMDKAYGDRKSWQAMALHNIAASGIFSSDRSIREYARDIWQVPVTRDK